jgi:hypothetical protein
LLQCLPVGRSAYGQYKTITGIPKIRSDFFAGAYDTVMRRYEVGLYGPVGPEHQAAAENRFQVIEQL